MKPAEMEALIIAQGEKIQAMQEARMHLVQRADSIVEDFKQELAVRDGAFQEHRALMLAGMRDLIEEAKTLTARVEKIETLVLARNASAATKRNMTDEDALRVLTGDLRDMSHKEAAEKIALTYAQVYSCRLEFTFKHVHKDLRDNVQGWKNPWSK